MDENTSFRLTRINSVDAAAGNRNLRYLPVRTPQPPLRIEPIKVHPEDSPRENSQSSISLSFLPQRFLDFVVLCTRRLISLKVLVFIAVAFFMVLLVAAHHITYDLTTAGPIESITSGAMAASFAAVHVVLKNDLEQAQSFMRITTTQLARSVASNISDITSLRLILHEDASALLRGEELDVSFAFYSADADKQFYVIGYSLNATTATLQHRWGKSVIETTSEFFHKNGTYIASSISSSNVTGSQRLIDAFSVINSTAATNGYWGISELDEGALEYYYPIFSDSLQLIGVGMYRKPFPQVFSMIEKLPLPLNAYTGIITKRKGDVFLDRFAKSESSFIMAVDSVKTMLEMDTYSSSFVVNGLQIYFDILILQGNFPIAIVYASYLRNLYSSLQYARIYTLMITLGVYLLELLALSVLLFFIFKPFKRIAQEIKKTSSFNFDKIHISSAASTVVWEVYSIQKELVSHIEILKMVKSFLPSYVVQQLEQDEFATGFSVTETPEDVTVTKKNTETEDDDRSGEVTSREHKMKRQTTQNSVISSPVHAMLLRGNTSKYLSFSKKQEINGLSLTIRNVAVLYVYISNFTTLINELGPDELIEIHSRFVEQLEECVRSLKGSSKSLNPWNHVIYWNARGPNIKIPEAQAAKAARDLLKRVHGINQKKLFTDKHAAMYLAMGLGAGKCQCGLMGTAKTKSFELIGDAYKTAEALAMLNARLHPALGATSVHIVKDRSIQTGSLITFETDDVGSQPPPLIPDNVAEILTGKFVLRPTEVVALNAHQRNQTIEAVHAKRRQMIAENTVIAYELHEEIVSVADEWLYELKFKHQFTRFATYTEAFKALLRREYDVAEKKFLESLHKPKHGASTSTTISIISNNDLPLDVSDSPVGSDDEEEEEDEDARALYFVSVCKRLSLEPEVQNYSKTLLKWHLTDTFRGR